MVATKVGKKVGTKLLRKVGKSSTARKAGAGAAAAATGDSCLRDGTPSSRDGSIVSNLHQRRGIDSPYTPYRCYEERGGHWSH